MLNHLRNNSGRVGIIILVILVFNITVGGLATEYVIEYWGTIIKDTPVDVPFFHCVIGGLFLGEIMVPAAVVTWLISFVI